MRVQVAAQIGLLDETRQRSSLRSLDFATPLPQFGRDIRQAQRSIDFVLVRASQLAVIVQTKQSVFVELQATREGAVPQRDVVGLRSREVLQRRAGAFGRHDPQVGLKAAGEEDARLRVAMDQNAFDKRRARERRADVWRGSCGQNIDVAGRLAASTEAADEADCCAGRLVRQLGDHGRGHCLGLRREATARMPPLFGESLEDQVFLARAHALRYVAESSGCGCLLQVAERPDVQLPIEQRDGLGQTPCRFNRSRIVGGN